MRRRVNAAAGGTVLQRSYPSGRDWHELRLSLTAAALDVLERDALGTLVACFLIGVAVAEAALAKALGQDSTAQLRRAGVLVDVDDARCDGQGRPFQRRERRRRADEARRFVGRFALGGDAGRGGAAR